MTITINNLSPQVIDTDLLELFSKYGEVQDLQLFPETNAASVALISNQYEEEAFRDLNGKECCGKALELELVVASPRGPEDPPHTSSKD